MNIEIYQYNGFTISAKYILKLNTVKFHLHGLRLFKLNFNQYPNKWTLAY